MIIISLIIISDPLDFQLNNSWQVELVGREADPVIGRRGLSVGRRGLSAGRRGTRVAESSRIPRYSGWLERPLPLLIFCEGDVEPPCRWMQGSAVAGALVGVRSTYAEKVVKVMVHMGSAFASFVCTCTSHSMASARQLNMKGTD